MIEELFVRWHSPEAIANFLDDHDQINWVSIYRHAYALGLDAVRRRNLGFVFENILDNAADATPTAAGVVAAARAISCIGKDGQWIEPEKRILMTTLVRHADPQADTSTDAEVVQNSSSTLEESAQFPFSLSEAAIDNEGASSADALCGSGLQPRQKAPSRESHLLRASPAQSSGSRRRRSDGVGSSSVGEDSVAMPSSTLPEAAVDTPAAASQTTPSGLLSAARRQDSVAFPVTALPEAAFDKPAAVKRTPPPGFASVARSATREIRLPHNSHRTKDKPNSNR
ncbi:MAG TPA: hypothetical protein VGT03_06545 [Candidatus Acidoferrales bacterium]|nr:hypothetical protein [Candidatus Acidoferrales bacterium]